MACCRTGDEQATSHYLNQWWPVLLMHTCVSQPEWVNINPSNTSPLSVVSSVWDSGLMAWQQITGVTTDISGIHKVSGILPLNEYFEFSCHLYIFGNFSCAVTRQYNEVTQVSWYLKSPATQLFAQQLTQTDHKYDIVEPPPPPPPPPSCLMEWPCLGDGLTGDRCLGPGTRRNLISRCPAVV